MHKPTKKSITQLAHNTGGGRSPDIPPSSFSQGPQWMSEQYHADHKLRPTGLYHMEPLAFRTFNVSLKMACSLASPSYNALMKLFWKRGIPKRLQNPSARLGSTQGQSVPSTSLCLYEECDSAWHTEDTKKLPAR